MIVGRPLLIFDEKGAGAASKEVGREPLEMEKLATFSGEFSTDVLLVCGDHEAFLKDAKGVDHIFDKILSIGGKFVLKCEDGNPEIGAKLAKHLQISGFAKVEVAEGGKVVVAEKKAEAGAVKMLSFADKINSNSSAWKISNEDEEFIDEDALLDEEDLKKPDPSSLKVCGTTGKRKACKDCSCGLAEELSGEQGKAQGPPMKSSCGNCYLGDAFRCASCPYAGMPAFKPGEKIQLSNDTDL